MRWLLWGLVIVAVIAGLAVLAGPRDPSRVEARLSAADALGGADTVGYARAAASRRFEFPADHGPHPEYRNEWWYVTGNLRTREGRRFGVQVTFFRTAVSTEAPELASDWSTRQLYMAHFALTDVENGAFYAFERFDRGALALAGAQARPFRVWLGDWLLESAVAGTTFPLRLQARQGAVAVDLQLDRGKPVVLQGRDGLSQKGPEPGNASYYYSLTRMPARGELRLDGRRFELDGTAWLDREWGTSALSDDLVGWDWFALQLDDGHDLMFYRLRRADGSAGRADGSLVGPDGSAAPLAAADVRLEPLRRWTSPGGVRYPSGWRLAVPGEALELEITPLVRGQELDLAFRYWEGAVQVEGTAAGRPVGGVGYVELTGYGEGRSGGRGGRDQPTAATSSSVTDAVSSGS